MEKTNRSALGTAAMVGTLHAVGVILDDLLESAPLDVKPDIALAATLLGGLTMRLHREAEEFQDGSEES